MRQRDDIVTLFARAGRAHAEAIGTVAVKAAHRDGVITHVMPEFDDVAALARKLGRPERLVLHEATTAAAAAGLTVGAALPPDVRCVRRSREVGAGPRQLPCADGRRWLHAGTARRPAVAGGAR